ncbi:MAG: Protein GrpE [Candidatus Roizmanbacteria bacterium GW2011_GWA2_33_33]|uniref:Protein GrpE n=1 Tax=Candidatus Roizmanbacteria bacterium GW2011_GWA2_33_33 TaxID=1618476 RepID=A0A0G0AH61_9BACT|nr:MAG: Protein GrpE [Candidatus Roizmanbacteria bacterium GW2011_GWA2_33_33]
MDKKQTKTNQKKEEKQSPDDLTKKLELEKIQLEIVALKQQVDEFKNKYLRAIADYQNLEKRVGEERFELMKMANKNLLIKILPFIDNLEKAELAIDIIPGKEENKVVEILRKGYKFEDKIIRVAQVKVSKKIINSK